MARKWEVSLVLIDEGEPRPNGLSYLSKKDVETHVERNLDLLAFVHLESITVKRVVEEGD